MHAMHKYVRCLQPPELLSLEDSSAESVPDSGLMPTLGERPWPVSQAQITCVCPSLHTLPLGACLQLPAQCRLETLIKLVSLPKPQVPQCDTFR